MRLIAACSCVVLSFVVPVPAQAAVVTVDVTIKAVNLQSRGITVVYTTELGEKTIELDVSRKAEITINGKDGTLDALGPGLKAKVTYDKDLAVVTKVEASGDAAPRGKAMELVAVSELNDAEMNFISWLSDDGLTVYWTQMNTSGESTKNTIWTAHRDNPQSFFANKRHLFSGGYLTLSSDGLEMILNDQRSDGEKGTSLYVTRRAAQDKAFQRPTEIPELAKLRANHPCLSADDLTLYLVCRSAPGSDTILLLSCTRPDRSSPWSTPKPVRDVAVEEGVLLNPFVTRDGLHLLCANTGPQNTGDSGNLMFWSRSSPELAFQRGRYIEPKSLPPLIGRGARYVAATHELFFSRNFFENKKLVPKKTQIWVVKNFTLPN